jgi:hypothetical protein
LRARLAIGILLLTFVVTVGAVGQVRTTTIAVDEIRRGMRGYGLTVFQGETPERFDVEVIDVLHNFRPSQDLILVRTNHPVLMNAPTVAGMSGSPVYIEGRLAGAYAYGWPFGRDPVIGVTPIASMMAEMARPLRRVWNSALAPAPTPAATTPHARLGRVPNHESMAGLDPYRGESPRDAFAALHEHAERFGYAHNAHSEVVRAATPILLGGFGNRAAAELTTLLDPFGLVPLQTGGSNTQAPPAGSATRFIDGGAIAVTLVRGDINATAVGTVTHVAGNRVIAFGHPMLGSGETGLPTATARVLHILASQERSFKIAEAIRPLGALVNDRQAAIVVDSSLTARTVPLTVRVHGVEGAPRSEWHMQVANYRSITPVLMLAMLTNAIESTAGDDTDVMFEARSRVSIVNKPTIDLTDFGYTSGSAGSARSLSRLRLFSVLEAVYGNPFEESEISGLEMDLTLRFERDVTQIVSASVAADEVDPGSTVQVHVTLRPYNGMEQVRIVPVAIPMLAAGTEVEIVLQPGNDVALEQPIARSLDDLLSIVQTGLPSRSLVISTRMPSRGLRFEGRVVNSLPNSVMDTMQLANESSGPQPFVTQERLSVDIGHVVSGSARLRVQVRRTPRP